MEVIKLINELKEVKRKIKKEKYHNANKLIKLAQDFKETNMASISIN